MKSGPAIAPIIGLSEWLKTPPGRYVIEWEQAQFDRLVTDIFGYHAVQLGLPQLPSLRTSRMSMIFSASEHVEPHPNALAIEPDQCSATKSGPPGEAPSEPARPLILTSLEELPFATQSIDLLVLPHVLEFAPDPHQILREVERVLIPEGQVIISGFNPLSLWGGRQALGRVLDADFLPRQGQFLALPRLKDWLKLLSFEVQRGCYGCYRPPLRSEQWLARYSFMEKAGDRWWPICGAVYLISAVKRVQGMRLIGPTWKDTKLVVRGLSPATSPSMTPSVMRPASMKIIEQTERAQNDG